MTWGSITSCDWQLELQVSNFSHCRDIFRTLCDKNLCGAKTDQSFLMVFHCISTIFSTTN